MPHEIVNIQVGGCGNQLGCKFWEVISDEHGVDVLGNASGATEYQKQRLNVYFNETRGGRFCPRAVLLDLDPASHDTVRASVRSQAYDPSDMFFGTEAFTHNNYAVGRYTYGNELLLNGRVMERVRQHVEHCDSFQGFQMTHSMGGSCGSGLCSLLLTNLHDNYPHLVRSTFSILPSRLYQAVSDDYNILFALHHLINDSTETFCFDNEALHNICVNTLKIARPKFADLNHLTYLAMSGITARLRFPNDQLNTDLNVPYVDHMVPADHRLHFMVPSFAPVTSLSSLQQAPTVPELTHQMYDPKTMMVACDPTQGRYLAAEAMFRGSMSLKQVDDHMLSIQSRVNSIPKNLKTAVCEVPTRGMDMSAIGVSNTTAIHGVFNMFKGLLDRFNKLFAGKIYYHTFRAQGMDEMEFVEAANNVANLLSEYQKKAVVS